MQRLTAAMISSAFSLAALSQLAMAPQAMSAVGPDKSWIERSNVYTHMLLDVHLEHSPEDGSQQGLAKFDDRISNPTLADQLAERRELEAVLAKIAAARPTETNSHVLEDLEILRKAFDLQFREEDFELQREVPFNNASEQIFEGLRILLDDQTAADRRPAALVRLRKYAGTEAGYKPFTELLKILLLFLYFKN